MSFDVVSLGELLIDFTENGISEQGNPLFEANPGGAPCNLLAMLSRLGRKTAFIGKVGQDIFGRMLTETLQEVGINAENLVADAEYNTTLAFVKTMPDGDRDFSFYRNPGADMMLRKEEINEQFVENTRIFHFGTLSMTHPGVRAATKYAVAAAKAQGAIISFDPNLREPLWDTLEDARKQIEYGLSVCDVLKIADNEIAWFTGENDYDQAVSRLREKYPLPLILLSLGKQGSCAYYKETKVMVPAFVQERTIDTTGAGDTFGGCCLHYILASGMTAINAEMLKEMLVFANAAAAIVTTKKGALRVMPDAEQINELIKSNRNGK